MILQQAWSLRLRERVANTNNWGGVNSNNSSNFNNRSKISKISSVNCYKAQNDRGQGKPRQEKNKDKKSCGEFCSGSSK